MIADFPADYDFTCNFCLRGFDNLQSEFAVIDKNFVSFFEFLRQTLVSHRRTGSIPHDFFGRQSEGFARLENGLASLEIPCSYLRSFRIEHDSRRHFESVTHFSEKVNGLSVFFSVAMRKIHSCNIHPLFEHFLYHLFVDGSRTQSTDYFCFSHGIFLRS